MAKGRLTVLDKMHIQELLMDDSIKYMLLKDDEVDKPIEVAKKIQVDNDGTVNFCFGKYVWWSKLMGDIKSIPFLNFILLVAKQLLGQKRNLNSAAWKVLTQDLLEHHINKGDYSYCIDALLAIVRAGIEDPTTGKFSVDEHKRYSREGSLGRVVLNSGEELGDVRIRFKNY